MTTRWYERAVPPENTDWERELAKSYRSADDLIALGLIRPQEKPRYERVLHRFKFRLTPYYASLIDRDDPQCPIHRQAIPRLDELEDVPGLVSDPLRDLEHEPVGRVTHRYPNRALFHVTPACSMYCRYCFRKSLLNELQTDLFGGRLHEALQYFREHSEIEEVIFSGGDPFLVGDAALSAFRAELEAIPHLKRIRFHTRVPVTFPMRVTETLARSIRSERLPTIVVTHFNHPKEVTPSSALACRLLREAGVHLLNQSVLLAGVNDSAAVLSELMEKVFEAGALPYYLHHPDRAAGTGSFDLPRERGLLLHESLQRRLPGYLVPRYVVDIVGQPYKRSVRETIFSVP